MEVEKNISLENRAGNTWLVSLWKSCLFGHWESKKKKDRGQDFTGIYLQRVKLPGTSILRHISIHLLIIVLYANLLTIMYNDHLSITCRDHHWAPTSTLLCLCFFSFHWLLIYHRLFPVHH